MDKETLTVLFEKYIRKLRITPAWDVRIEFVEDTAWTKQAISGSTVMTGRQSCC